MIGPELLPNGLVLLIWILKDRVSQRGHLYEAKHCSQDEMQFNDVTFIRMDSGRKPRVSLAFELNVSCFMFHTVYAYLNL